MKIQENISLIKFNTFQINNKARYFTIIKNTDDLREAFAFAKSRKLPILVLGGGSNILLSDHGFSGLVIKNEIKGIKFIDQANDEVFLEVGAGEILDEIISLSIIRNLCGLENLSGIPGTVGGVVVQNAGAYGVEIKDVLLSAEGLNMTNGKKFILNNPECQYGYRDSLFKRNKKFVITMVTLRLSKKLVLKLDYYGLKDIAGKGETAKPNNIRQAILKIREEKLPDWHIVGTAGSFFKNPIITNEKYNELKEKFPELPGFSEIKNKTKIPLAWIMDKICNLKGYSEGNVGLYEKQPLILVNYGGATEKEIDSFANKIKNIVKEKVGLEIEEEVEKIK